MRFLRRLRRAILILLQVAVIAWAALAIWFSNLPWPALRVMLALAFTALGIWALWIARTRLATMGFAAVLVVLLVWWSSIPPSHDRPWRTEVAVMPRAVFDGDRVRISGVRNFDYRTVADFVPRYEEREVSISKLRAIDFYVSYWMPGPVGHTFVSFVFDDAPPLAISIEARPEVGEGYAPLASLFKQFELIYVVGDERDLVRVRTNFRGEDVYLYRIEASPETARKLFVVYLERINELADRPEFYHLLSNSCTINMVRYANGLGRRGPFDIRHYLNGLFDTFLYDTRRIATTLPFEELRRRSHINASAVAAGKATDFSVRIRENLPQ
jgi:hypothetical protein